MMRFDGKVLIIGYGSVAQCTPHLLKHIRIPYGNITIIDFEDKRSALKKWTNKGVTYLRQRITPENIAVVLSEHLSPGSLLIDLSWNIDAKTIIKWCHDNEVLYINTSVEIWDSLSEIESKDPVEKSLYHRQLSLREMAKDWNGGTTAVVDHGANPGLITHFVKQALVDISERMIGDNKVSADEAERLRELVRTSNFAELAMLLKVKVITAPKGIPRCNNPRRWGVRGHVEHRGPEGGHRSGRAGLGNA